MRSNAYCGVSRSPCAGHETSRSGRFQPLAGPRSALAGGVAAVHGQDDARNKGGFAAGQEGNCRCNLLWLPEAAHGVDRFEVALHLLSAANELSHGRVDVPGCDRVDPHAALPVCDSELARAADNTMFGCGVGARAWLDRHFRRGTGAAEADQACHRSSVDDRTAAAFREERRTVEKSVVNAAQVDRDGAVPPGAATDASVVEDRVQAPELANGLAQGAFHGVLG